MENWDLRCHNIPERAQLQVKKKQPRFFSQPWSHSLWTTVLHKNRTGVHTVSQQNQHLLAPCALQRKKDLLSGSWCYIKTLMLPCFCCSSCDKYHRRLRLLLTNRNLLWGGKRQMQRRWALLRTPTVLISLDDLSVVCVYSGRSVVPFLPGVCPTSLRVYSSNCNCLLESLSRLQLVFFLVMFMGVGRRLV